MWREAKICYMLHVCVVHMRGHLNYKIIYKKKKIIFKMFAQNDSPADIFGELLFLSFIKSHGRRIF